ncbi:MAG: phosphohistidine phosphatase SixA [Burkholderiaceae bacterium]
MELILWRHADAEIGEPDPGRQLTPRGEKQARRVAEWLHARLPDTTRVLVSPAARAQQTARALLDLAPRTIKTIDEIAPGASVAELLAAVDWPRSRVPVLVVGHQPTLGAVAAALLSGQDQDWAVKKGGVWWLSSRERGDVDQVVLRAVINPDLV